MSARPQFSEFQPYHWFATARDHAPLVAVERVTAPASFPRSFSAAECAAILELAAASPVQLNSVGVPIEGHRYAESRWIPPDASWKWVVDRLEALFMEANERYQFELSAFVDDLLVATYPEGGQFAWHLDTHGGITATRKLSVSIQLSERADYDGGQLEFAGFGEVPLSREIGTAVCFPSFTCHRVLPVQRGVRHSLVAFAHGPSYR